MKDDLTLLKEAVHKLLGPRGGISCKVVILPDNPIVYEIRWKRDYLDDGVSDERYGESPSLGTAFRKILDYEQRADEDDAQRCIDETTVLGYQVSDRSDTVR